MPTDKAHRNYSGHFVYPDDAQDLKCHPFFSGIPWANMQDFDPPFIPRVRSWEDTKYFDEEDGSISDMSSETSDQTAGSTPAENDAQRASYHHQEGQVIVPENPDLVQATQQPSATPVQQKKAKVAKRARDKSLRDAS